LLKSRRKKSDFQRAKEKTFREDKRSVWHGSSGCHGDYKDTRRQELSRSSNGKGPTRLYDWRWQYLICQGREVKAKKKEKSFSVWTVEKIQAVWLMQMLQRTQRQNIWKRIYIKNVTQKMKSTMLIS
jgi:hypothetical protein